MRSMYEETLDKWLSTQTKNDAEFITWKILRENKQDGYIANWVIIVPENHVISYNVLRKNSWSDCHWAKSRLKFLFLIERCYKLFLLADLKQFLH